MSVGSAFVRLFPYNAKIADINESDTDEHYLDISSIIPIDRSIDRNISK